MGVDIAGLGLIFIAALAGFVPGVLAGIWIVSHRNYAAWKKKKKQVRRQIEKSRKSLDRAKAKDLAKQKKEFRKRQKDRRKEEKRAEKLRRRTERDTEEEEEIFLGTPEEADIPDTDAEPVPADDVSEPEVPAEEPAREEAEDASAGSGRPKKRKTRLFGRKKKKDTLLESRMQTCISDMSFECAENGTSEKEMAREYQKKQDDAYRI